MHCHIEFHNAIGMGLIVQVGEPSQFPRRPKNFPTCGDWRYTGLEDDGDASAEDDDTDDKMCGAPHRHYNGSFLLLLVVVSFLLVFVLF